MKKTQGSPAYDWIDQLGDSVTSVSFAHRDVQGWRVEARWWTGRDEPYMPNPGPRQVVISATPALDAERQRHGVTPGVLRELAPALGELISSTAKAETDTKYRLALRERVAKLRGSPRSQPEDYYRDLLQLFSEVEVISDRPINDLAEAMRVPKETVKSRLRNARRRISDGANKGED